MTALRWRRAGFVIVGFIVGLTFTIGGGGAADLTYHATILPC